MTDIYLVYCTSPWLLIQKLHFQTSPFLKLQDRNPVCSWASPSSISHLTAFSLNSFSLLLLHPSSIFLFLLFFYLSWFTVPLLFVSLSLFMLMSHTCSIVFSIFPEAFSLEFLPFVRLWLKWWTRFHSLFLLPVYFQVNASSIFLLHVWDETVNFIIRLFFLINLSDLFF